VLTLPGMYFSDLLSSFVIWETGHIFIDDEEGHVIANIREEWVQSRINYIKLAQSDSQYDEAAAVIRRAVAQETGIGHFSVAGVPRICAYRPIASSQEGWFLGVVAPLPESPFRDIDRGLLMVGFVCLALSVIAAIVASAFIKKPFEEIAKLKEAAESASLSKSNFLANMSHEIRTPMNAIIGMTDMLMHSKLSARDAQCVSDINTSARSLLSIINEILDLAKIESGKAELCPVHYDFRSLVDNVVSMFTYAAKNKSLEFAFESEGELPEYQYGDDVKLRQMLNNICGNAVKFTEKGGVSLKVITSQKDGTITFEIKDTGMGIKGSDIPIVFNAFEQSKSEKNRKIVGTGLGLAISRAFAEMMGGHITLESEYGAGSIFRVVIPQVAGDAAQVEKEEGSLQVQTMSAPGVSALVVDDNEFNLKVAQGLLELFEIDAKTALSGKQSIEMIQNEDFDIVFMDHMMPEMDGIETVEQIRGLGGKYADIKIIALTANAIQGAREMFLENGFDGFLSKPIEIPLLARILKDWLPHEKITESIKSGAAGAETSEAEPSGGFLKALGGIPEINTEIALRNFTGQAPKYKEAFEMFHKKLPDECAKMAAQLGGGDFGGFKIAIHGMKSTLAIVGAAGLSDQAAKMEAAIAKGDEAYCQAEYPAFREALMSLHERLKGAFPDAPNAADKPKGDPAFLRDGVQKALKAAEDFDNEALTEAVAGLLAYDYGAETNGQLESATQAANDFRIGDAQKILEQI
jgi:signal transduction histidine kinase/DNA-binding NarL/FixJ family response regulator/HPt (histidine-containing phosphotransfer) domain-containing protein